MRASLFISAAVVASFAARPAAASPLFELTGDAAEQGGLNARASGPGAASAYFNPALLPDAPAEVSLGVFLLNDQVGISLDGRNGGDIPLSYRGATHANGAVFEQTSLPTEWLRQGCRAPECPLELPPRPRQAGGTSHDTKPYQSVGLVIGLIPHRLVLGFYGLFPIVQFTTANSFFSDEREQFFTNSLHPELYSDRLTATSLALALGAKIVRGFSIGVGTTLSLRNTANAQTFVGNADDLERTLVLSTDVGVKVAFAPHFGLAVDPLDWLHLTATLHSVQRFDIASGISTFLPDGNKQLVWRTTVHDYMPLRLGFGVRVDLLSDGRDEPSDRHELALVASAVLSFWSSYLDRHGEQPTGAYAWSDTPSIAFGARHSYGHWRSHLDGSYVPTPVPLQTGRSNYVDNDRYSVLAGVDYDFNFYALRFRVGVSGQLHVLAARAQRKSGSGAQAVVDEFPDDAIDRRGTPIAAATGLQTNNPGWPGFSSSGVLLGAGVTLAVLL